MKFIVILVIFQSMSLAHATLPYQVSREELVRNTDHVLIGHVIGVDMFNDEGIEITDSEARTEPFGKNVIRLIVRIDEVIISNSKNVPEILKVPLDSSMHYSLGQIKSAHKGKQEKFILLLKGKKFEPPFPGIFKENISNKKEILEAIEAKIIKHVEQNK